MDFNSGDRLGEMHGHEPSCTHGALRAFGYKPVSIIEIGDEQAAIIAASADTTARRLRSDGKFAYCVASNDTQVVVIYFYDTSFFLTTLTTSTPNG